MQSRKAALCTEVFCVRLGRTLAVSLRLTVSQLEYQAMPKHSHLLGVASIKI